MCHLHVDELPQSTHFVAPLSNTKFGKSALCDVTTSTDLTLLPQDHFSARQHRRVKQRVRFSRRAKLRAKNALFHPYRLIGWLKKTTAICNLKSEFIITGHRVFRHVQYKLLCHFLSLFWVESSDGRGREETIVCVFNRPLATRTQRDNWECWLIIEPACFYCHTLVFSDLLQQTFSGSSGKPETGICLLSVRV